jgi:hypothetical protein
MVSATIVLGFFTREPLLFSFLQLYSLTKLQNAAKGALLFLLLSVLQRVMQNGLFGCRLETKERTRQLRRIYFKDTIMIFYYILASTNTSFIQNYHNMSWSHLFLQQLDREIGKSPHSLNREMTGKGLVSASRRIAIIISPLRWLCLRIGLTELRLMSIAKLSRKDSYL